MSFSKKLQRTIKRTIDMLASGTGLVVLSPVLGVTAGAIYLNMGSPILFRQIRPGKKGALFELVKFRTMAVAKDDEGIESDGMRITPLGKVLRKLSLDELPTLINVVKGEMSLVGPRPLLVRYLDRYTKEQARRHEVTPGITGLAQINGRNAIGWNLKFEYDVWYIDNWSLVLDFKILRDTLLKVVRSEDINSPHAATMTEFKGMDSDEVCPV